MFFKGIELCCPACQGELEEYADTLTCQSCTSSFPVLIGIPDLRVFADPYIDIPADRAKGLLLAKQTDAFDFEGVLHYYYQNTQVVPPQHAQRYMRGLLTAGERAEAFLDEFLPITTYPDYDGLFLDLGCGTAPLCVAAARKFRRIVGVDIAFRWLVVAQKRLKETGLDVPLICACAEALPFKAEMFSVIASESALEHLKDQKSALAEINRMLIPGGQFYASTPNRYSLGPDPQVGIFAGGYLPEAALAAIVRRQGGIPPIRKLHSARSLLRLVGEARLEETTIFLPHITNTQRARFSGFLRTAIDLYSRGIHTRLGRWLFTQIGPLLFLKANRPVHSVDE